ncbi:MAG: hypothetical protein NUW23_14535 [Firmicutes bacterium]|nr:hypothetical protein [Bacillota bacterium]
MNYVILGVVIVAAFVLIGNWWTSQVAKGAIPDVGLGLGLSGWKLFATLIVLAVIVGAIFLSMNKRQKSKSGD